MEFAGVAPMQGSPMGYGGYQQSPVPDELHGASQQPPLMPHPAEVVAARNGDEHALVKPVDVDPSSGSPKNGPRPPRNNNPRRNGPQQPGGYHQSYYNNNGYSNNRPRPGRGGGQGQGPRSQGNRPPTQNAQKPKTAQH